MDDNTVETRVASVMDEVFELIEDLGGVHEDKRIKELTNEIERHVRVLVSELQSPAPASR